jgi:hypothetical protein
VTSFDFDVVAYHRQDEHVSFNVGERDPVGLSVGSN